jgi:uncharacterized protein
LICGDRFDSVNSPGHFEEDPEQCLKAYAGVYLREEIQIEAQIRNLAQFSRFLEAASFSQASVLSVARVAQECGVDRKTAENYFQLLEDLMIGIRLPVFQRRARRKLVTHSKFFFFDTGVFHTLRPAGPLDPRRRSREPRSKRWFFRNCEPRSRTTIWITS